VVAGAQGTSAEALSQLADQLEASVQRANEAAETLIAVSADSERTRSAAERHPSTGEQSELVLEGLQAVQVVVTLLVFQKFRVLSFQNALNVCLAQH
jgi:hypothetical protein